MASMSPELELMIFMTPIFTDKAELALEVFNTRRYTLVQGFCFFWLFFRMGCKELTNLALTPLKNRHHLVWPSTKKFMYVCVFVCSQSCSFVLPWTWLTVCESDDPSSNPAQCSFFFVLFFSSCYHCTTSYTLAIYWPGRTYVQPN